MGIIAVILVSVILTVVGGCGRGGGHHVRFRHNGKAQPQEVEDKGFLANLIGDLGKEIIETGVEVKKSKNDVYQMFFEEAVDVGEEAAKLKKKAVHVIAGVEAETVDGVIAAKVGAEKVAVVTKDVVHKAELVAKTVEKIDETVLDAVESLPSFFEKLVHYTLLVLEVLIGLLGLFVLIYLTLKFRKYYKLIKGHSKATAENARVTEFELEARPN